MKTLKRSFVVGLLLSTLMILFANYRVNNTTSGQVFASVEEVPFNKVGLLLGTSKNLKSGKSNLFFDYRIDAAVALFKAGKIQNFVVSGDNSEENYNEPQDMKDALIERGIPAQNIYLDYAGFRTYDSVYRVKAIFGQSSFTIISQEFHNQRALYIANALGLDAIAFNAKNVETYGGFLTNLREKFARVKVLLDLLLKNEPKFLGEKVLIK